MHDRHEKIEKVTEKNYIKTLEKLENELYEMKYFFHGERDYYSMVMFCNLKSSVDEYLISQPKLSQMQWSGYTVNFVIFGMLVMIIWAIAIDEGGDYTACINTEFPLFFVKWPCAVALHFAMYPQVLKGMKIMKFANNQPDLFIEGGSQRSFVIGFIQVFAAVTCEAINIMMLAFQHAVSDCIIFFVALKVIMLIGAMYMESLMDNPLQKVLEKPIRIKHRGIDIKFKERTCFHKIARILYKFTRGLYVGVIFYFAPFLVIFI